MKTAVIIHYHLKPGGVTRVIETAIQALERSGVQTLVLSASSSDEHSILNAVQIDELAYTKNTTDAGAQDLAQKIKGAAHDFFGHTPDIWHIHNHSLGKNAAMADCVKQLADDGEKLLLQIHDFAEDGRPENYTNLCQCLKDPHSLYPISSNVHYAVLNLRDYQLLLQAGMPESQLHMLPNAVNRDSMPPIDETAEGKYLVYPSRAIRRKNIGEMVLWSTLRPDLQFAISSMPQNPEMKPFHDRWVDFSQKHKLPLQFNACETLSIPFPQLLSEAKAFISTSIAEGFGLAFLEPWILGKALVGRDIPDITADFKDNGLNLTSLYKRLNVPIESVSDHTLKAEIETTMAPYLKAYGRTMHPNDAEAAYQSMVIDGQVDFGMLNEPLQEHVIENHLNQVQLLDPNLHFDIDCIASNQSCIDKHYNIEQYQKRLDHIYHTLEHAPHAIQSPGLAMESVLDAFIDPKRFNLLRT